MVLIAITLISLAVSGCLAACLPTSAYSNNTNAKVTLAGDTITITGTKTDPDHDQYSDKFDLKKGAYLMTWENSNQSDYSFNALLEAKGGIESLGYAKSKDSSVLVIGDFLTQPGLYKLDVMTGDTYTVTITKPTTGTALPLTIDQVESGEVTKAIQLNPGILKVNVHYKVAKKGWTSLYLYDVNTGEIIYTDSISVPPGLTRNNTTSIPVGGVYILKIDAPINETTVTISQ